MRSIKNQSRDGGGVDWDSALALVAAVSVAACSGFRAAACGGQKVGRPRMEHLSRPVHRQLFPRLNHSLRCRPAAMSSMDDA